MLIPEDKINIFKHFRKSLLYHNEDFCIKKEVRGHFENPHRLLANLNNIIIPCNHGLYRDDGLIIEDNCTPGKGDLFRKKLHWLFNKFGFKLDNQTNLKITDYLDITLNLYNGTMSPLRENNQYPYYINVSSNHPSQIFKYIFNGIIFRLSTSSSNINIFFQNKHDL